MAGFGVKSHDMHTFAAQGIKVSRIHANKPLINQWPEWQSSPVKAREKVTRCSPAPCDGAAKLEPVAGTDTARQGCAGTEQPGDRDIPVPGSGCSGSGVRDAPALGSGMLHPWGQDCFSPGVRDAPSPGSGTLHPWDVGCSL